MSIEVLPYDRDIWEAEIERKRAINAQRRTMQARAAASQRTSTGATRTVVKKPRKPPVKRDPASYRPDPSKVAPHWSETYDLDWIEAQFAAGETYKSVAKKIGIGASTFSSWYCKHRRLVRAHKPITDYTRADVLEIYNGEYIQAEGQITKLSIPFKKARTLFVRERLPLKETGEELPRVNK